MYLLDTSTFLWWVAEPGKLSRPAHQVMLDATNRLQLSAASVWEIAIKVRLGKLTLHGGLAEILDAQVRVNGLEVLPLHASHAIATMALPMHHADPFDRLLVAQAKLEKLTLVTPDPEIARYEVDTLW